jgi:hypothetical protein
VIIHYSLYFVPVITAKGYIVLNEKQVIKRGGAGVAAGLSLGPKMF